MANEIYLTVQAELGVADSAVGLDSIGISKPVDVGDVAQALDSLMLSKPQKKYLVIRR